MSRGKTTQTTVGMGALLKWNDRINDRQAVVTGDTDIEGSWNSE
jgi:hypothetical protein